MASLITAGGLSAGAFASIGAQFVLQLGVGAAVGIAGGRALLWFTRRVPLRARVVSLRRWPAPCCFRRGHLGRGSGFLAVFAAGIVLGDEPAPFKREIVRFHSAVASLAEIVAFVVLGLNRGPVRAGPGRRVDPGVILGAALAFVIRPPLIGLCLIPAHLDRSDRNFVLFAGLKGAVADPAWHLPAGGRGPRAQRLYGIIAVVVLFSVGVQGSGVPAAARLLRLQMRTVEPEPWRWACGCATSQATCTG